MPVGIEHKFLFAKSGPSTSFAQIGALQSARWLGDEGVKGVLIDADGQEFAPADFKRRFVEPHENETWWDFPLKSHSNLKHTFDPAHHERVIGLDNQSAEHFFTRDDHHAALNHQPLHNIEHALFCRDYVTLHRKPSILVSMISAPA
jgi:hypothetical protein